VKIRVITATLRPVRSSSFNEKNNYEEFQEPKKRPSILDTNGTKSSFNDFGKLLSNNDLKCDGFKIHSTKELSFLLSPKNNGNGGESKGTFL